MKDFLSLVKFSHTIFALPFALLGFTLAISKPEYSFSWDKLILVILCMVTGRNAAMAFNRYIDRDIDLKNPRTQSREIPSGIISPRNAMLFVLINSILFMLFSYWLNFLCFILSPVALLIILGYSYTKRFTFLCHLILGLGLSLAPIGAYLAVTATFDIIPIIYGVVVLFWVAGFDIIYALQDEEFDKSLNLYSIPEVMGKKNALLISNILHLCCGILLVISGLLMKESYSAIGIIHWVGVAVFLGLLGYQHILVKPDDLSRVNKAFFTTNGIASVLFSIFVITDLILQ